MPFFSSLLFSLHTADLSAALRVSSPCRPPAGARHIRRLPGAVIYLLLFSPDRGRFLSSLVSYVNQLLFNNSVALYHHTSNTSRKIEGFHQFPAKYDTPSPDSCNFLSLELFCSLLTSFGRNYRIIAEYTNRRVFP